MGPQLLQMTEKDFRHFSSFIYKQCAINLGPGKKEMLASRLSKRLKALKMKTLKEYRNYLMTPEGEAEKHIHLLDVVSTNKTDFFREPVHFDFLTEYVLPLLIRAAGGAPKTNLKVWSAGCSTGEEPYTLGFVLSEYFEKVIHINYSILASDLSTRVLDVAKKAVYSERRAADIPKSLKRKYLLRGKGSQNGYYKIVPELKTKIMFQRINLNNGRSFGIGYKMDIIFCRNVLIYFDRATQKVLVEKMYSQLNRGGFLFTGHSESIHGLKTGFENVATSVYYRP